MEIKQVHVISSSEGGGRKERVGEGEKSEDGDGGNHGYEAGMVEDDAQGGPEGGQGWNKEQRDDGGAGGKITCSRCAAVVLARCVGRTFSDEENLCLSLPPLQNPPSSSHSHSRPKARETESGR